MNMQRSKRNFSRKESNKDAQNIYIFCEGRKREYQYFLFFQGLDSRVNLILYPLKEDEDNSPTGLYNLAENTLIKSENNPDPEYGLLDQDEVWFVIDTDAWGEKINQLRAGCTSHKNWNIAQSNPCFEVWLYFHLFDKSAELDQPEVCATWKELLSTKVQGGFSSQKHTLYIGPAIQNASKSFTQLGDGPDIGSTQVFLLAKIIYNFCQKKIDHALNRL
jgi:hypothetical protein